MIKQYLNEIIKKYKTGQAQEHSYRKTLEDLLIKLTPEIQVINEPKKQKCGKPDYIILKKNIPVGYIEAKDVCINLDDIEHSEQLERYRSSLENLLLTNYLEFRFFVNNEKVHTVTIAEIKNNRIVFHESEFKNLTDYLRDFCTFKGQTIKSPRQLAHLMAQKAAIIRDVIIKTLESHDKDPLSNQEYHTNSLVNQRKIFKEILLHDLTDHTFADMYAQTIAYGLFVARLNDNSIEDFSRHEARDLVSKNNPFLRQLFDYISGANLDDNLIWIVDDLVEIFRCVDLNKLLKNYGETTQTSDPFLHFYETFLESYDKVNRRKRGVYYTPQPVVRFIVSAVDTILKKEFNLAYGLADDTKTTCKISYPDTSRKKTKHFKEIETYKVQILDPATGTGTFLAETIRKIYSYVINQKGAWSQYVDKILIPRLNGFEIMMTPYVMCHLKLDLLLQETGYTATETPNRFNVYLTNSLEKDETTKLPLLDLWLSEEAKQAGRIKSETPLMVIMGNPPYSVSSSNKNDFIDKIMEIYKQDLNEKNIQPLSDDYIKFIRIGENYIERNSEGILAYISNNSFLDGVIHRQMRKHLLKTFDKIYILDLHGNAKKKECCSDGSKDENVFDIQQGVSINIFVKTVRKQSKKLAQVYHAEVLGLKEKKFAYLNTNGIDAVEFTALKPAEPYYFFVPKNFSSQTTYEKGFKIDELMPVNASGIKTQRDDASITFTQNKADKLKEDFLSLSVEELARKYGYKNVRDWNIASAKKDLKNNPIICNKVLYRPFDIRCTNYTGLTKGIMGYPRLNVMKHMIIGNNVGLIISRMVSGGWNWNDIQITKHITELGVMASRVSNTAPIFPLYLYDDSQEQTSFFAPNRTPNLNMDIVHELEQKLQLTFTPEKESTESTFAPIDLLDYIYGILHSNKYRSKYKEFLKIDFPHIPYPDNANYFFKIAEFGKQLRQIHLMEAPELEKTMTTYPESGDNEVNNLKYKDNNVYINKIQYFKNVPENVWNFYIGGYQPAKKWLKDRKGRILNYEDILHYQKIIAAITKTITIMNEIDKRIKI